MTAPQLHGGVLEFRDPGVFAVELDRLATRYGNEALRLRAEAERARAEALHAREVARECRRWAADVRRTGDVNVVPS